MRTTLGSARSTDAEASTRRSGGSDGGAGPAIDGNGSTRANARRTVRGGAIVFSRCRILDCCTSSRRFGLAGELEEHRARDPDDHEPERRAGGEPADRVEHPQRRNHRQRRRARTSPATEARDCSSAAPTAAPISAASGV